ncbi:MAG: hypothetical protein H6861_08640 [Rhodospirillales bacterium]|nr:hypothetical protein [Rhodospirillales bacterium]
MSDTLESNHAELWAQQVEKLGVNRMGFHELAAFYGGFPPGQRCIATPVEFRDKLETGQIKITFSSLSLAKEALNKIVGNQPSLDLGGSFGMSAKNADQAMPTLAQQFIINPGEMS